MRTLIKNIKELVQVERQPKLRAQGAEMAQMETVKDAYLLVEDGIIKDFGPMRTENGERCRPSCRCHRPLGVPEFL